VKNKLLKVCVWRMISIIITLLITFLTTGSIILAAKISVFLPATLMFTHLGFEFAWDRVTWGIQ